MSATTANAIKSHLEAAGLGVTVYRDGVVAGTRLPYISVSEAISVVPETVFNRFDDTDGHVTELAQVDVWQQWREGGRTTRSGQGGTGKVTEDYELADAVYQSLNGAYLSDAPTHVGGLMVTGMVRLLERDANVVHHAITVEIHRTLTRSA